MAVSTNLGLYLPTRDDYISVQRDLSSNYEIIDEHAGMMENGIAIVINGDTAPKAITAGQYLFIKNHSTLATGGYHATANIALGATISNSNVAADADGIANALNSKIGERVEKTYYEYSASAGHTFTKTLTDGIYILTIATYGPPSDVPAMYMLSATSAASYVACQPIKTSSSITVSSSGMTVSITSAYAYTIVNIIKIS